jgi:amino acid adenylation domain-containing protein
VHTGTAKFDLSFDVRDDDQGLWGRVEFKTGVFTPSRVEDICQRLCRLLHAAITEPSLPLSQLPLLTPDEVQAALTRGQGPEPGPAVRNVIDLIVGQARRTPEAPAVIASDGVLSYGELEERTRAIACGLAALGVGREDTVGLSLPRRHELIPLVLGVMRAGAAYLPLDPAYPPARLQAMVATVTPALVVHDGGAPTWLAGDIQHIGCDDLTRAAPSAATMPEGPEPEDTAYVLFTSGSTGTPKGVVVPHSALVNLVSWSTRTFDRRELHRVLVGTSLNFDLSVVEILAPLVVGGCAVLVENALALRDDPHSVSLVWTVPTALAALADAGAIPEHVTTIVSGGEALSRQLAGRLLALPQQPRLVNTYGPTEATVLATAIDVTQSDHTPSIGLPLDGTLTLVVDRFGCPLPIGFPGELWIGGRALSDGYLGDAALTAERFVMMDVPGAHPRRMYRTGDLVWCDDDGALHFLRRQDDQLKVHGIRIEPGDVEATLISHPAVSSVAVFAVEEEGVHELHAAVTSPTGTFDASALRAFAAERLSLHMVPRHIELVDQLPLNLNGKVDRRALAAMATASRREAAGPMVGSTPVAGDVEGMLLSVWGRILRTSSLTVDSDFFVEGGDSLHVLAMLNEVERLVGCRLPLDWCFSGPITIRRLANEVRRESGAELQSMDGTPPPLVLIPVRSTGHKAPLFVIYAIAAAALSARSLIEELDPERPVYALAPVWADVVSREDLVRQMAGAILGVTTGPAHLAGHSIGGPIAYETAALLESEGHAPVALVIVDSRTPKLARIAPRPNMRRRVRAALPVPTFWRRESSRRPDLGVYEFPRDGSIARHWIDNPAPLQRPIDLLVSGSSHRFGEYLGWDDVHQGPIHRRSVPGNHFGMLKSAHVHQVARVIDACLQEAETTGDSAS